MDPCRMTNAASCAWLAERVCVARRTMERRLLRGTPAHLWRACLRLKIGRVRALQRICSARGVLARPLRLSRRTVVSRAVLWRRLGRAGHLNYRGLHTARCQGAARVLHVRHVLHVRDASIWLWRPRGALVA